MAATIAKLSAQMTLNPSGFVAGAAQVERQLEKMRKEIEKTSGMSFGDVRSGVLGQREMMMDQFAQERERMSAAMNKMDPAASWGGVLKDNVIPALSEADAGVNRISASMKQAESHSLSVGQATKAIGRSLVAATAAIETTTVALSVLRRDWDGLAEKARAVPLFGTIAGMAADVVLELLNVKTALDAEKAGAEAVNVAFAAQVSLSKQLANLRDSTSQMSARNADERKVMYSSGFDKAKAQADMERNAALAAEKEAQKGREESADKEIDAIRNQINAVAKERNKLQKAGDTTGVYQYDAQIEKLNNDLRRSEETKAEIVKAGQDRVAEIESNQASKRAQKLEEYLRTYDALIAETNVERLKAEGQTLAAEIAQIEAHYQQIMSTSDEYEKKLLQQKMGYEIEAAKQKDQERESQRIQRNEESSRRSQERLLAEEKKWKQQMADVDADIAQKMLVSQGKAYEAQLVQTYAYYQKQIDAANESGFTDVAKKLAISRDLSLAELQDPNKQSFQQIIPSRFAASMRNPAMDRVKERIKLEGQDQMQSTLETIAKNTGNLVATAG